MQEPLFVSGNLAMTGSSIILGNILQVTGNISLQNQSIISHNGATTTNQWQVDITASSISIDATSKIDVSGRGYLGAYQGANNSTVGRTLGNTTTGGSDGSNGGSYGGLGGSSNSAVNAAYGDLANPNELGSGGGGGTSYGYTYPGSNGGGLVRLKVGTLVLDGSIVANGSVSSNGGGSGGGIRIDAESINSTNGLGAITANGGSGSKGGGGGRIAIYYGTITLPLVNVVASGGSGTYRSGNAGTVFITTQSMPLAIANPGTGSGTTTSTPAGITCGATCSYQFTTFSTVTLTASPAPGSTFTGWSGACTGMGTCTVTMDSAKNVTATFAVIPPPTVIISSPSGYTKNNRPLLQYTISSGTVVVKVDGAVVSKVSGNYLDALPDGPHTVHVEATNAGVAGFADSPFVVDTVVPILTVNPVPSPSITARLTLTGTVEAGANLKISANTTATVGSISFGAGTWSCTVSNLAPGSITFTITALDQATNNKTVNITVTYEPTVALALSTTSIAADYQGTVGMTINSINPPASEVFVEQLVDANQNGVADAGDYVIRFFKVTDGTAVANPNMQGDTDGTANGTVTTTLNYFLMGDLYHTPGHYLFRATKETQTAVVPFTATPVSQTQTIAGMVMDGTNLIPGALLQLTDKWQRHVAYAVADTSGSYVLNVKQSGNYNLLPVAYGYMATATPVTLAASQNIENLNLTLTSGSYHLTGNVKDATTGLGIAGVWVQASDGNNGAIAMTDSNGVYDLLLPSGQYSVSVFADATGPSTFAKGYVGYNKNPLTITVNGNMAATDITLSVGNIPVSGRVLDITGNPVPGLAVMGMLKIGYEAVNLAIADDSGTFTLGLHREKGWNISLDQATAQTLGYIGTTYSNLTVNTLPLSGKDLTVHPITAWVQGVVKNSASQLLSGVEVKLRNADTSITASVVSASDGTYRLGAFAGNWFIDALTENKGTHAVTEQAFALSDGQQSTIDFTVDVTPPSVTIDPLVSPTRVSSQTATGTMEAGSTITVSVNTSAYVGTVSYPTSTTWSCDITNLLEGANAINVTATDTAGNPAVATSSITIDTISPTVVITSPTAGLATNQTPLLTYAASDGTIVVKVDNVEVNKVSGNTLDIMSYGTHTVQVEATDAAGILGLPR